MEISNESKILIILKNIQDLPQEGVSKMFDIIRKYGLYKPNKSLESPNNLLNNIPNNLPQKSNTLKSVVPDKSAKKIANVVNTPLSSEDNDNNMTNNEPSNTSFVITHDSTTDDVIEQLKYNLILKYVNNMLKNSGMQEIKNLSNFRYVDKEYLHNEANIQLAENMTAELSRVFDKKQLKSIYDPKRTTHTNLLRKLVKSTKSYMFCVQRLLYYKDGATLIRKRYSIKKRK